MTRKAIPAAMLLALAAAGAHAQLYRWVAPDGKVTYSDTPPPASAKQVETRSISAGDGDGTAGLPYELAQAVKASPVTLYTTNNCIPCDEGRRHLAARGIPFAEKTVNGNNDIAQLQKAGGDAQRLPFLTVGRLKERGFEATAWNSALSAAGYPETSMLPKSYRAPPPEAAAPPPAPKTASAKDAAARTAEQPQATEPPPAAGNAPPGFRF